VHERATAEALQAVVGRGALLRSELRVQLGDERDERLAPAARPDEDLEDLGGLVTEDGAELGEEKSLLFLAYRARLGILGAALPARLLEGNQLRLFARRGSGAEDAALDGATEIEREEPRGWTQATFAIASRNVRTIRASASRLSRRRFFTDANIGS